MASQRPQQPDALTLLKQDHDSVKELFTEFKRFQEEKTEGVDELKQDLMDEVCHALKMHTQLEEEIFYPVAREALPDEEDLFNEADVEHASAKELIAQVESGNASDPMTCARFLVLAEQIEHHVEEEEEDMFPKLRKSTMDTRAIGGLLAERKKEFESEALKVKGTAPAKPSVWDRISSLRR
jgi:hemerythrin-like domain-containing protein